MWYKSRVVSRKSGRMRVRRTTKNSDRRARASSAQAGPKVGARRVREDPSTLTFSAKMRVSAALSWKVSDIKLLSFDNEKLLFGLVYFGVCFHTDQSPICRVSLEIPLAT